MACSLDVKNIIASPFMKLLRKNELAGITNSFGDATPLDEYILQQLLLNNSLIV